MPKKLPIKGASWIFKLYNILSSDQTENGAFEIIDNSQIIFTDHFRVSVRRRG
jgi:hypothetical protein